MNSQLSTADVATLLGEKRWKVARVFEDGSVPEPRRHAGRRVIGLDMLPQIAAEIAMRGCRNDRKLIKELTKTATLNINPETVSV